MKSVRLTAATAVAMLLAACATAPSGADLFSKAIMPISSSDEAVLVIFRQVTPPTIGSLTVRVNDAPKGELPNNSFLLVKLKAGQANMLVTYPAISILEPIKVQTAFEPGSTHYLEIVGGLGKIYTPGPYVQVWRGLIERREEDAIQVLTKCCRRIGTAP